jgi:hypothetical protein
MTRSWIGATLAVAAALLGGGSRPCAAQARVAGAAPARLVVLEAFTRFT